MWIVTFSDCMTLLLCFFVMLVSFSSFDESSLEKVAGAFATPELRSMADNRRRTKDSALPPKPRQADHTEAGSDMPTDEEPRPVLNPRAPLPALGPEAYAGKQVFYVPSQRMYWGSGSILREPGKELLQMLADFAKLVPCDVVIGEFPGASEARQAPQAVGRRGMNRSLAAIEYLIAQQGIEESRLHVACTDEAAPGRFGGQAVVRISLLSRRADP
jgi:flagellar motor protein MotB